MQQIPKYYAYIIQSQTSGRFYIGSTANLEDRIAGHNSGKTPTTRNKGPWTLVYREAFETKTEALKRERAIKAKKSAASIRRIIGKHLLNTDK